MQWLTRDFLAALAHESDVDSAGEDIPKNEEHKDAIMEDESQEEDEDDEDEDDDAEVWVVALALISPPI